MKGLILLCMVLTAFSLLGGQEADTGGQEAGTGGQENVTGGQENAQEADTGGQEDVTGLQDYLDHEDAQEADTGGQENVTGGQEDAQEADAGGQEEAVQFVPGDTPDSTRKKKGRRNPQMTSKFEWAGKKSSDMCRITPKTWHKLGSNADKIIIKVTVTFNKPVLKCTLR